MHILSLRTKDSGAPASVDTELGARVGIRLAPVIKPAICDVGIKATGEEGYPGIKAPGAGEVNRLVRNVFAEETAFLEDKAVFLALRCAGRTDVSDGTLGLVLTVIHRDDLTGVKPSGGTAENEVDISFNRAFPERMMLRTAGRVFIRASEPARLNDGLWKRGEEDGVLIALEGAALRKEVFTVHVQGDGLGNRFARAGAVDDREPAKGDIVCGNPESSRTEGALALTVWKEIIGTIIPEDAGLFCTTALQNGVGTGNDHFFAPGSGTQYDACGKRRILRKKGQGFFKGIRFATRRNVNGKKFCHRMILTGTGRERQVPLFLSDAESLCFPLMNKVI